MPLNFLLESRSFSHFFLKVSTSFLHCIDLKHIHGSYHRKEYWHSYSVRFRSDTVPFQFLCQAWFHSCFEIHPGVLFSLYHTHHRSAGMVQILWQIIVLSHSAASHNCIRVYMHVLASLQVDEVWNFIFAQEIVSRNWPGLVMSVSECQSRWEEVQSCNHAATVQQPHQLISAFCCLSLALCLLSFSGCTFFKKNVKITLPFG